MRNRKKKSERNIEDKVTLTWEERQDIVKKAGLTHGELVCGFLRQSMQAKEIYPGRYEISGYCALDKYQKCTRIAEPGWDNRTCGTYKKMITLPLIEEGWLNEDETLSQSAKDHIASDYGNLDKIKNENYKDKNRN